MKEYLVFILTFLLFSTLCYPQWVKVDSGLPGWESQGFAIDALNGSFALISVGLPPPASTLYKTIDGGISWNPLIVPNSSELTDVAIVDENRIFVCNISGPPLIIGTSDGGDNWENLFDASSVSIFLDYIEFFGENNGMVMGDAVNENSPAAFIQTSDGGQNWNPVNNSLLGGFSGNMWTRIDFVNQDIGYFFDSQTQKLLKTINGGSDWAELTSFPSVTPMVIKFYDQNIGLALQTYVGVFRTFNGGTTWDTTSINTNSYGSDIEFLPNDPSKILIATLDELFFSSDAGATWQMDPISGSFEDGLDGWSYMMRNGEKDFAMLYFENGSVKPTLKGFIPEKQYMLTWFDPRNGKWEIPISVKTDDKGSLIISSFPDSQNSLTTDWALKITTQ